MEPMSHVQALGVRKIEKENRITAYPHECLRRSRAAAIRPI